MNDKLAAFRARNPEFKEAEKEKSAGLLSAGAQAGRSLAGKLKKVKKPAPKKQTEWVPMPPRRAPKPARTRSMKSDNVAKRDEFGWM